LARIWVICAGIGILILAGFGFFTPVTPNGYTTPQLNDLCVAGYFENAWVALGGKMMFGQNWEQLIKQDCENLAVNTGVIYLLGIVGLIVLIVGGVVPGKKKESGICPYCNFVATSENELLDHKAKNHLDKSPYKCEHCDFIGITEEILWNHYNDKHPDKKKW